MEPFNTAILLVTFNRPATTRKVFETIRSVRPSRLYLAADGPRVGQPGDSRKVNEVRRIITSVDWPCEVKTLFRDTNQGCRFGVSESIDWFFSYEKEGVILEDDCVPHKDFFPYVQWALKSFRHDKRIWHINGNNFLAPKDVFKGESVSFTTLPQVWGWATWADRWKAYQGNPFYLRYESLTNSNHWGLSPMGKLIKLRHIEALTGGLNTWDYQWQITVLNNGGLAVTPSSNLISNIGDGTDATHTQGDSRANLQIEKFAVPTHATPIVSSKALNSWYEKKMGLRNLKHAVFQLVTTSVQKAKAIIRRIVGRCLFGKSMPIVVASTGRSGSTLLTDALALSFVSSKFNRQPQLIKKKLAQLASEYLDRIQNLNSLTAPVIKTHDQFKGDEITCAKIIFLFGDPLESALSVREVQKKKGSIWVEQHIFHLNGQGSHSELFSSDVLNYENSIKSWAKCKNAFFVHYQDLWQCLPELNKFVGFEVNLPDKRSRSEKELPEDINLELFKNLKMMEMKLRKETVGMKKFSNDKG